MIFLFCSHNITSKNTSQTLPFIILLSGSVVLFKLYVETECKVSMERQCMWDAIVLEDILYIYTLRPWMNVSEAVWWTLFTQAVTKLAHYHKRGVHFRGRGWEQEYYCPPWKDFSLCVSFYTLQFYQCYILYFPSKYILCNKKM